MRILLPVDGSRHAKAAVNFVATRASVTGVTPGVTLLNVQPRVTGEVERLIGKARLRQIREQDAHSAVKSAMRTLRSAQVEPSLEIRVGSAGEEIAERAQNKGVDLIVMGARGLSEIAGLFIGSQTSKVLGACKTPVLLVRAKHVPASVESMRVGIALDGSRYGQAAVRYALKHSQLFGPSPTFLLMHVAPDYNQLIAGDLSSVIARDPTEAVARRYEQDFDTAFARARAMFQNEGIGFEEVRLIGSAGDEIAAYAKKHKLDCVVLGSHGKGRFWSAVLGSVATRVAARCEVPLLLIRSA